jgi:hypothetical protein
VRRGHGSHVGLAFNRRTYRVIGDRLASEAARAREAPEFASTSR